MKKSELIAKRFFKNLKIIKIKLGYIWQNTQKKKNKKIMVVKNISGLVFQIIP